MSESGQAIILAAGLGVRMGPLTASRAKPSLPVMNRPLILHLLDLLSRSEVRKVVVNLHHAPETIEESLDGAVPGGMEIGFSRETEILGTGGGIRRAMKGLDPTKPVVVLNGDSLTDAGIAALVRAHEGSISGPETLATLCLKPRDRNEKYTPVHVDRDGRICGIGTAGRKGTRYTFTGLHVLDPTWLNRTSKETAFDIVRKIYMPHLKKRGTLGAFVHEGVWLEMGTPALYLAAHRSLLENVSFMRALPPQCGTYREGGERALLGPGSDALAGQVVDSVVGPGSRVEEGASVTGSVLGVGAKVERGANVEDSIVWDRARIPRGETVKGSLVVRDGAPGSVRSESLR